MRAIECTARSPRTTLARRTSLCKSRSTGRTSLPPHSRARLRITAPVTVLVLDPHFSSRSLALRLAGCPCPCTVPAALWMCRTRAVLALPLVRVGQLSGGQHSESQSSLPPLSAHYVAGLSLISLGSPSFARAPYRAALRRTAISHCGGLGDDGAQFYRPEALHAWG